MVSTQFFNRGIKRGNASGKAEIYFHVYFFVLVTLGIFFIIFKTASNLMFKATDRGFFDYNFVVDKVYSRGEIFVYYGIVHMILAQFIDYVESTFFGAVFVVSGFIIHKIKVKATKILIGIILIIAGSFNLNRGDITTLQYHLGIFLISVGSIEIKGYWKHIQSEEDN